MSGADGLWDGSAVRWAYIRVGFTQKFKIGEPGRYVTRKGEHVTIDLVDRRRWAHGRYDNGIVEHWFDTGRVHAFTECENDIVAKAPS